MKAGEGVGERRGTKGGLGIMARRRLSIDFLIASGGKILVRSWAKRVRVRGFLSGGKVLKT